MGALHPIGDETVRLVMESSARREQYRIELARRALANAEVSIAELEFCLGWLLDEDRPEARRRLAEALELRDKLAAEVARG